MSLEDALRSITTEEAEAVAEGLFFDGDRHKTQEEQYIFIGNPQELANTYPGLNHLAHYIVGKTAEINDNGGPGTSADFREGVFAIAIALMALAETRGLSAEFRL